MNYRDYLQQVIYKIINPLIHGMIKIGITPNFITTTGFILNVVAAFSAAMMWTMIKHWIFLQKQHFPT